MAGQTKEIRQYVLLKDRGAGRKKSTELKNMNNDEIANAVARYGLKAIIEEYRATRSEPPVDILLRYLYNYPQEIKKDEVTLLQKAYGVDYIMNVCKKVGVKQENISELGFFGRAGGWFGRMFNAYDKVYKFDEPSLQGAPQTQQESPQGKIAVSKIRQAERQIFENIKNVESDKALTDPDVEAVEEAVEQMEEVPKEEMPDVDLLSEISGSGGEAGEGTIPPAVPMNPPAAPINPPADSGKAFAESAGWASQVEKAKGAVFAERVTESMLYRSYIRLPGYDANEFDLGVIQYFSPELSVGIWKNLAFPIKNANFTIVYDSKVFSEFAAMSQGSGTIRLGLLNLGAEGIQYVNADDRFEIQQASASLGKNKLLAAEAAGVVNNISISKGIIDFDEASLKLAQFSIFGGKLAIENPQFHMKKEGEAWTKDISMTGGRVNAGTVSLTLFGGENASWKLQEASAENSPMVKGEERFWEPNIQDGTAKLNIKDAFELFAEKLHVNRDAITAGKASFELGLDHLGDAAVDLKASAESLTYDKSGNLSWAGMKASGNVTVKGVSINVDCKDIQYDGDAVKVSALDASFTLESQSVVMSGKDISYSKGELTFDTITVAAPLSDIGIGVMSFQHPMVSLSREAPKAEAAEDAAAAKKDAGYQLHMESGLHAEQKDVFLFDVANASVQIGKGGIEKSSAAAVGIEIFGGKLKSSAGSLTYSKKEDMLQGTDVKLETHMTRLQTTLSAGAFDYSQQGLSVKNLNGDLNVGYAGFGFNVTLADAELRNDKLSAAEAGGKLTLNSVVISVTGKDLSYRKDAGFDFTELTGGVEELSLLGQLKLTKPTVLVKKEGEKRELGISAGVALNASGISMNIPESSFTAADGELQTGELINPDFNLYDGLFHAKASKLSYTRSPKELTADAPELTTTNGEVTAKSVAYKETGLEMTGINGKLNINFSGVGAELNLQNGTIEQGKFSMESTGVTLTIGGKKVEVTGTNLSYSTEAGFEFETLALKGDKKEELILSDHLKLKDVVISVSTEEEQEKAEKAREEKPEVQIGNQTERLEETPEEEQKAKEGSAQEETQEEIQPDVTAEKNEKRKKRLSLKGGFELSVGCICLSASDTYLLMVDGKLNRAHLFKPLISICDGVVSGETKTLVYENDTIAGTDVALKLKLGDKTNEMTVGTFAYDSQGFTATGIEGKLEAEVAGAALTGDLHAGSVGTDGIEIASAETTLKVQSNQASITGTGIKITKSGFGIAGLDGSLQVAGKALKLSGKNLVYDQTDGFNFGSLKGSPPDLSVLDVVKLENTNLAVSKNKDDYAFQIHTNINADIVDFHLGASDADFLIESGELASTSVKTADVHMLGKKFEGTINNLQYSKENSKIEGNNVTITANLGNKPSNLSAGQVGYAQTGFYASKITNELAAEYGGTSMTFTLTDGKIDSAGFGAAQADGTLGIRDYVFSITGTNIEYTTEKGAGFEKLEGSLKGKNEIVLFNTLSLNTPHVSLAQAGEGKEFKISAGAKLTSSNIKLAIAESSFTMASNVLKAGYIKDANFDVFDDMFHANVASLNYTSEPEKLSATSLTLTTGLGEVGADSVAYDESGFKLSGMHGNLKIQYSGAEASLNFSGGKVEQEIFSIATTDVTMTLGGQKLSLDGTDLSYSKENGFGFGSLSLKADAGKELTFSDHLKLHDLSVSVSTEEEQEAAETAKEETEKALKQTQKDGQENAQENAQGTELEEIQPEEMQPEMPVKNENTGEAAGSEKKKKRLTLKGGFELSVGCINLKASDTYFLVVDGKLDRAKLFKPTISICDGLISGETKTLVYENDGIAGTDVELQSKLGGKNNSLKIGTFAYNESKFTATGLSGDLEAGIGGTTMTFTLTDGTVDSEGIKAGTATGTLVLGGKKLVVTGTNLSYSTENGFEFDKLESEAIDELEFGGHLKLKDLKISVSTEEDQAQVTQEEVKKAQTEVQAEAEGGEQKEAQSEEQNAVSGETQAEGQAETPKKRKKKLELTGGFELSTGGISLSAKDTSISMMDGKPNRVSLISPSVSMFNGAVTGNTQDLVYENGKIAGTSVTLKLNVGDTASDLVIGKFAYSSQGFTAEDISANLKAAYGGMTVSANLETGKVEAAGITIESAKTKLLLKGNQADLTGTKINIANTGFSIGTMNGSVTLAGQTGSFSGEKLEYQKEAGFSFAKLEGSAETVSILGAIQLTDPSLSIIKQEKSYAFHAKAGISGEIGSSSLTASAADILVEDGAFTSGSATTVSVNLFQTFIGSVDRVDYSKAEGKLEGTTATIAVHLGSTSAGTLSAETIGYGIKGFYASGVKNDLAASYGGTSMTLKLDRAAIDSSKLSAALADGTLNINGTALTVSGTDISYGKTAGFDFATLKGGPIDLSLLGMLSVKGFEISLSEKSIKGSGKELNGTLGSVTVSANAGNFAVTAGELTEGTIAGGRLKLGQAGILDGTLGQLTYVKKSAEISGEAVTLSSSLGNTKVTADSFAYGSASFTVTNLGGSMDVGDNITGIHAVVDKGNLNKDGLTIDNVTGSVKVIGNGVTIEEGKNSRINEQGISVDTVSGMLHVLGKDFHAEGTMLKYEKETGFDFATLSGTPGDVSLLGLIKLTGAKVELEKSDASYAINLNVETIDNNEGLIHLKAGSSQILIQDGKLSKGEMDVQSLDILSGALVGKAKKLEYTGGEDPVIKGTDVGIASHIGKLESDFTAGLVQYTKDGLSMDEISGAMSLDYSGTSVSVNFEKGKFGADEFSIEHASGTLAIGDKLVTIEGTGFKYSQGQPFSFDTLKGGLSKLDLFGVLSLSNLTVEADNAKKSLNISAGIQSGDSKILQLKSANVGVGLTGQKLNQITIDGLHIDIAGGLLNSDIEKGVINPDAKSMTVNNLEINVGSPETANLDQLKNTGGFLSRVKNLGITVGTVTYSDAKGLEYSDFKFKTPSIKIPFPGGAFYVDFENNKTGADFELEFPSGGKLESSTAVEEQINPSEPKYKSQNHAKPKGTYIPAKLFGFSIDYPLLPGVNVGGGFAAGAGLILCGSAGAAKNDKNYKIDGIIDLLGGAFLAADLHIGAGVKGLVEAKAKLEARLGVYFDAGLKVDADFSHKDNQLNIDSGIFDYGLSAEMKLSLLAGISAKILWFKEKTLYEKKLGEWQLGKLEIGGNVKYDGTALSADQLKDTMKLNGKDINENALSADGIKTTDKVAAETPVITIEDLKERYAEVEEERKKLENALLGDKDTIVIWSDSAGEAPNVVLEQIKMLSGVYTEELHTIEAMLKDNRDAIVNVRTEYSKYFVQSTIVSSDLETITRTNNEILNENKLQKVFNKDAKERIQNHYMKYHMARYMSQMVGLINMVLDEAEIELKEKGGDHKVLEASIKDFKQARKKINQYTGSETKLSGSDKTNVVDVNTVRKELTQLNEDWIGIRKKINAVGISSENLTMDSDVVDQVYTIADSLKPDNQYTLENLKKLAPQKNLSISEIKSDEDLRIYADAITEGMKQAAVETKDNMKYNDNRFITLKDDYRDAEKKQATLLTLNASIDAFLKEGTASAKQTKFKELTEKINAAKINEAVAKMESLQCQRELLLKDINKPAETTKNVQNQ